MTLKIYNNCYRISSFLFLKKFKLYKLFIGNDHNANFLTKTSVKN